MALGRVEAAVEGRPCLLLLLLLVLLLLVLLLQLLIKRALSPLPSEALCCLPASSYVARHSVRPSPCTQPSDNAHVAPFIAYMLLPPTSQQLHSVQESGDYSSSEHGVSSVTGSAER